MANVKPRDGIPTGQEFSAIRVYLAQNKPSDIEAGDWADEITEVIGDDVNERTRAEIIGSLTSWMKAYSKATP